MHLVSYCFTKQCGGLMVKTLVWNKGNQDSILLTNIYYVEYVYLYVYLMHVCKCIIFRWVVDRWVGGHGEQVGHVWVGGQVLIIYLFIAFYYLKFGLFFIYINLVAQFFVQFDQSKRPSYGQSKKPPIKLDMVKSI